MLNNRNLGYLSLEAVPLQGDMQGVGENESCADNARGGIPNGSTNGSGKNLET